MLPTEVSKKQRTNPARMVHFAHPKSGKTQALSGLPDNLIIDLEDGSGYVEGRIVNVLRIAADRLELKHAKEVLKHPKGLDTILGVLKDVSAALARGDVSYDHITIDTASALIEIATHLATLRYKATVIGKNFTGSNVVKELPNGGGYEYLRDAFDIILDSLDYAKVCFHIVCHVKDASLPKMTGDISARDINLPGKMKIMVCSKADAIGFMYRKDGTKTILSFKNDERDLATGARPEHLANKEFVICEETPAGSRKFVYAWDKVFVDED